METTMNTSVNTYIAFTIKHYVVLTTDAILLAIPWLDNLDAGLKVLSLIFGLILTVYIIIRVRLEIANKKLEIKIKKKQLEKLNKGE